MKLERQKPKPVTWKALVVILLSIFLIPFYYVAKTVSFFTVDGTMWLLNALCNWAEKKGPNHEHR